MGAVVQVEVSPGELIDKITILEIKAERIADPDKLANVQRELRSLTAAREDALAASTELDELTTELRRINERLWEIEDAIRNCERNGDFGERFIQLARAVYRTNDGRAAAKRSINELMGSELVEEKDYVDYQAPAAVRQSRAPRR